LRYAYKTRNCRRTEKVRIFGQRRTGRKTSGAKNAVGGVIKDLSLLGRLDTLLLRDRIFVDQKRIYGSISFKKSILIHDKIPPSFFGTPNLTDP
jgi:hypothetical protein